MVLAQIKDIARVAALSAVVALGGATAGAATTIYETFDLYGSGGNQWFHNFSSGDLTMTATAYKHSAGVLGDQIYVGRWGTGLGAQYSGDDDHKVDGNGDDEMVLFAFNREVTIEKVWISYYDTEDDIEIASYSVALSLLEYRSDVALTGTINGAANTDDDFGWTNLTTAQKLAASILGVGSDHSSDQFKIKKIKVSYENTQVVPLPASGLLLLGAFGGLAAMRRRKKS